MTRDQIEQQLLREGIRCHGLIQTRSGYVTDAHYSALGTPSRNLQVRIVVDGQIAHVFVFEEVKTFTLKPQQCETHGI